VASGGVAAQGVVHQVGHQTLDQAGVTGRGGGGQRGVQVDVPAFRFLGPGLHHTAGDVGEVETGDESTDGVRWTSVGTARLPGLPSTVQAGCSSPPRSTRR
jgi:hypothetical protein